jgi:adenylate kinase
MLNLVLFGPPGAGKGTQSEKLLEHYGLTHLSTGDVFRYNIKNETELGLRAKSYIDQGELVPDEVTINMVKDFIAKHIDSTDGFIFDGFPRTVEQGKALDHMLSEMNTGIDLMVALEVDEDELVRRLLERGKVSGRADDQSEDTIRNRFAEYNAKTAPLKEFYTEQGKYHSVKGMGSVEDIFNRLVRTIDSANSN